MNTKRYAFVICSVAMSAAMVQLGCGIEENGTGTASLSNPSILPEAIPNWSPTTVTAVSSTARDPWLTNTLVGPFLDIGFDPDNSLCVLVRSSANVSFNSYSKLRWCRVVDVGVDGKPLPPVDNAGQHESGRLTYYAYAADPPPVTLDYRVHADYIQRNGSSYRTVMLISQFAPVFNCNSPMLGVGYDIKVDGTPDIDPTNALILANPRFPMDQACNAPTRKHLADMFSLLSVLSIDPAGVIPNDTISPPPDPISAPLTWCSHGELHLQWGSFAVGAGLVAAVMGGMPELALNRYPSLVGDFGNAGLPGSGYFDMCTGRPGLPPAQCHDSRGVTVLMPPWGGARCCGDSGDPNNLVFDPNQQSCRPRCGIAPPGRDAVPWKNNQCCANVGVYDSNASSCVDQDCSILEGNAIVLRHAGETVPGVGKHCKKCGPGWDAMASANDTVCTCPVGWLDNHGNPNRTYSEGQSVCCVRRLPLDELGNDVSLSYPQWNYGALCAPSDTECYWAPRDAGINVQGSACSMKYDCESHNYDARPYGPVCAILASSLPPPAPRCGVLDDEDPPLTVGQSLWSCNRRFELRLQNDGNLVLYMRVDKFSQNVETPLWASNTVGSGARQLIMQGDANLVLYNGQHSPKWASGVVEELYGGHPAAYVTEDGDLVTVDSSSYEGWGRMSGAYLGTWDTGTEQR
jgi:hypothetical protein